MAVATRNSSQENIRKRSSSRVARDDVDVGGLKPSRSRKLTPQSADISKNQEESQLRRSKRVRVESQRIVQQRQIEEMAAPVTKNTTIVIPGGLTSTSQISGTGTGSGSGSSTSNDKEKTRKALTISIPLSKKGIRLSRDRPEENLRIVQDNVANKTSSKKAQIVAIRGVTQTESQKPQKSPKKTQKSHETQEFRDSSDSSETDFSAYDTALSGDDDESLFSKNQDDRVDDFTDSDNDAFYDLSDIDESDDRQNIHRTTTTNIPNQKPMFGSEELNYGEEDAAEKDLEMFMAPDARAIVIDDLPLPAAPAIPSVNNSKQSLALIWDDSEPTKVSDDFSLWTQSLASLNHSAASSSTSASSLNSSSATVTTVTTNVSTGSNIPSISTASTSEVSEPQEESSVSLDDFLEYDDSAFSQPPDSSNQSIWIERYSTIPIGGYRLRNSTPNDGDTLQKPQTILGFKKRSILTGKTAQMVSGFSYSYKCQ